MVANLENSVAATGLEKVSFHSNPKEGQCQRMLKLPHNCAAFVIWLPDLGGKERLEKIGVNSYTLVSFEGH